MKSLKTRLIVVIALLVTLCTAVLTIGSYLRMKAQIENDLSNEIRSVASSYNAVLSNWIQVNTSLVDSLSKGLTEGNDLQASLKMVSRGGNFLSVYLGQPDKPLLISLRIHRRLVTIPPFAPGIRRQWMLRSLSLPRLTWASILPD